MLAKTTTMDGRAIDAVDWISDGIVITCEHGGNRIPAPYRRLFHGHQTLLDSHRGYDAGALIMARALARTFAAPLVVSTVSRLLVDLNRSVGHPRLHSEATRKAPAEVRQSILKNYYQPYRAQAERLVSRAIAKHGRVIHLSSHSFTPELDGKVRNTDIGLLYDPARPGETNLCELWETSLEACALDLAVRRNYPYAGKADGLTAWFRRRLPPGAYIGIELEINQKHVVRADRHWSAMRKAILESLRRALVSRCAEISP
jgi:predicted N-formylglutamate amidohydrolase